MSVVCVFNDKETLDEYLIKGLENQNSDDFELILVDNTKNRFKSAASALNYGAKKSKSEYIVFSHQDVSLPQNWFKKTEKLIKDLKNPGIIGVAGKMLNNRKIITNIEHGIPPFRSNSFEFIENPVEVGTVDECLFIIPTKVFNELKFDEKCCNGWHFYAVDYSLSAKSKGYNIYTIPSVLHHKSAGGFENYFISMKKVLEKHKNNLIIPTTCGNWITHFPEINENNPRLKNSIINDILNNEIKFNNNVPYEEYFQLYIEKYVLKNKLKKSEKTIRKQNKRYNALLNSKSWKLTRILRKIISIFK